MRTLFISFLLIIPIMSFGQKKVVPFNEGKAPKVVISQVGKDSLQPIQNLEKNKSNRIKVQLVGGVQKIKHTLYVTSKNADVKKDPSKPDEYIIIPQNDECEIIVDLKTEETYFHVEDVDKKGRKVRKVIKEYPPKTYMLTYERYPVK